MKTFVLTFLVLVLLPVSSIAAPVPPLEALELLRKGFAGMDDFTADITQEKQLSVLKKKLVSTGNVRFKKPDLFFMELSPPHASRMVLRDTAIELYLPKEKSRQQIALPSEEGLKKWIELLAKPVTKLPDGLDARADSTGGITTLAIKPGGKGQISSFTLICGPEGRLRKLTIEERNGNRTAISFHKMRSNVGLTEKDFKAEP